MIENWSGGVYQGGLLCSINFTFSTSFIMCPFYLSLQYFSLWKASAPVFPLIDGVLREKTFLTLCKIRHCCLKLLWGILYWQALSSMISLPLTQTHTRSHTHARTHRGITKPSKEVWHAFVRTFFVSRDQGTLCRGGCPCSVSPLSPYIPKLHLSLSQPSNGRAFRCWPYRVEVKARSGICC